MQKHADTPAQAENEATSAVVTLCLLEMAGKTD